MALNITFFFVPLPLFLAALIVIVGAIITLTLIERRLHKQVVQRKEEEDTYFLRKLANIKKLESSQPQFILAIDEVAREFFEEAYNLSGVRYSELIEHFKKENNGGAVRFCEVMQQVLYSGETLQKEKVSFLFEKLSYLIREKQKETLQSLAPTVINKIEQAIEQPTAPIKNLENASVLPQQNVNVNQNIVKYLREGIKRNIDVPSLKKHLLSGGFVESEVDRAIMYLGKYREMPQSDLPRPEPNELMRSVDRMKLAQFLHPKNQEIATIKKEVEDREEETPKAEIIEIVPYTENKIEVKKKEYPQKEPKSYEKIQSLDDLDRIKSKIAETRQTKAIQGYGGANFGKS